VRSHRGRRPAVAPGRSSLRPAPAAAARLAGSKSASFPGRNALIGLAALGALIVLFGWASATGSQPIVSLADGLNAAGRVTGLLGTYLVLWQLLLMARVPALERAVGMESLLRLHRLNAYAALSLIVAHAVFQTAGYAVANHLGPMTQLSSFISGFEGMLMAVVALGLMLLVTILSMAAAKRRIAYQTWYFIHLYAYLAVALATVHELAIGTDFLGRPWYTAYWVALYAVTATLLLWFRVGAPFRLLGRHRLRVARVEREANGISSLYLQGRNLAQFHLQPGQFMLWRFLDRERWWEAHPFSVSSLPNPRFIRLTVRASGDFSRRLSKVVPGTPVMLEGPFGRFTAGSSEAEKVLLIAGGIGITPIRPLAEHLAREGREVRVLYRCQRERELAFRAEFDQLSAELPLTVDYLVGEQVPGDSRRGHWSDAAALSRRVPDVQEREVYLCGPQGLMDKLLRSLTTLSLAPAQVHVEAFRF